mmetsp:Transcript_29668/g.45228  ORF Transcript_29668/g.45228 Transcript_29668/m.45228 type:complete len:114 (+) Transcript_29668:542-883(+)
MQSFKEMYPSVFEAKVICDPVSRVSKGYGFIKFAIKEESERALQEMQGKIIMGRAIKMNYASQRNRNNSQAPQQPQQSNIPPPMYGGAGGYKGGYGGPPPHSSMYPPASGGMP